MRRLSFLTLMFIFCISNLYSQRIGDRPNVASQSDMDAKILSVDVNKDETVVTISISKPSKKSFSFSSGTTLTTQTGKSIPLKKFTDGRGWLEFNKKYRPTNKTYYLYLYFNPIYIGTKSIDINENYKGGKYWKGISLKMPSPPKNNSSSYSRRGSNNQAKNSSSQTQNNSNSYSNKTFESKIKQDIIKENDGITGIYEAINSNGYKMACTRLSDGYKLTYYHPALNSGNTKAILRPTAIKGIFKSTWIMDDNSKKYDILITFDGATMKVHNAGEESLYLKMFPTATVDAHQVSIGVPSQWAGADIAPQKWSGTGFALKNGYIATNYHVVEGAKKISVIGIKGAFNIEYKAEIIATDKVNDLAIIKINDKRFGGFGIIPYRVKTTTSEVGEDIFVLGYPLTTTMGDEIKLTTGVISSKTGFQGDVSLYQISAPIQPGNSGGPLFDRNGNVVGIVNAKHQGAENVGYAIKTTYLRNLMESTTSQNILPANNSISGQALTGKVKSVKNFVFMIKCSN